MGTGYGECNVLYAGKGNDRFLVFPRMRMKEMQLR